MLFVLALAALAGVVPGHPSVPASPREAPRWPVVLRVGDEARTRGDVPSARRAYLTALFRARGERSRIGVLSAAEGFRALGDHEVMERALEMAATLDPGDGATPWSAVPRAPRDRLAATDALPMTANVMR